MAQKRVSIYRAVTSFLWTAFVKEHLRVISWFLIIAAYVACVASVDMDIATAPNEYVVFEESVYFEIIWPESLTYTYKIKQARDFGTKFDRVYHKVELVQADPEEGCQDLYNDVSGTVVFILRGGCSFLTKSKVAERAGALAVIIADNDESNDVSMIDMINDSTERVVGIPSFFMLGKDGSMIRRQLRIVRSDRAIINIPVNLTGKPLSATKRPPWTVW